MKIYHMMTAKDRNAFHECVNLISKSRALRNEAVAEHVRAFEQDVIRWLIGEMQHLRKARDFPATP